MKLTIVTTLCLVWLLLSLTNCTKSLVYSPSLNLPPKPLKKNQVQLHRTSLLIYDLRLTTYDL